MIETVRIEQWLYALLSGDSLLSTLVGGRIYSYVAPQGAPPPWPLVVYSYQGGYDVRGVGPARIMVSAVYQIKAIGQGQSFAPLQPVADRLDALLQGASGSVLDGQVLMCVREQPVAYVEISAGVPYRHLGGLWRMIAQ